MVPSEFLLGAALITAAPQYQMPLLVGTSVFKAVTALRRRQSTANAAADGDNGTAGPSRPQPVTLEWRSLSCSLSNAKTGVEKQLLSLDGGSAVPGRLLAVMGPSGSGKTTLLNILAGQLPQNPQLTLCGSITVNGVPISRSTHGQGYVQQEDIFYSQLTIKETLMMAAHLRLPEAMADDAKEQYVDGIIQRLGMSKSADTIVGDAKVRGLSGGEKKRLSIGCELIASPSLVFADEPTSGLDSFQAQKVMQTLKQLAEDGHTVVCSIHQPRSSIFELFDDLLLLTEGRAAYAGPAAGAVDYFAARGHPCPERYNPAEFLADLISTDTSSPDAEHTTRARVQELVDSYQPQQREPATDSATSTGSATLDRGASRSTASCSWPKQLRLLFGRSWRQVTRDKATNFSRAGVNVSSALIFGSIFWRMRRTQTAIQDRMGLLQVVAVNTAMSSLVKTLAVFPRERTIVMRERGKKAYDVLPYFGSKLIAELPVGALFPLLFGSLVYPMTGLNPSARRFASFLGILTLESFTSAALGLAVGSVAPSTEAAVAIGPAVMVVFIVFGGVYVNADNVPTYLKWLPRTSMIKYAYEALCVNEFRGTGFDTAGQQGDLATGQQVLQRMGYGNSTVRKSLLGQGRVLLFNYWLTYCVLKAKKPQFQPLLPASTAPSAQPSGVSSEQLVPEAMQPGRNGGGNGSTPKRQAAGAMSDR